VAKVTDLAQLSEKEIAKEILTRLNFFEDNFEGIKSGYETVKDMATELKNIKNFDSAKFFTEIDRLKANQEQVVKAIANNKSGFYIPGLEDQRKKFSLHRACVAIKYARSEKDWEQMAPFEKEVFDQTKDKAAHVVGIDSQGGYFVPDQVIADVIGAIYTRSIMVDLAGDGQTRVSVIDGLVGIPVKIPKFDGGMIAYWIGEEDSYAESSTKVGNVNMTPKKLGVFTRITDEMRRFQGFGYETLFRNDMIRAVAKKIDWTVLYGTGTDNMPRGVIKLPGLKTFSAEKHLPVGTGYPDAVPTDSQGGELTFDDLDEMEGILNDQDIDLGSSFAFISAPRYFRRLKKLKILNFSGQTSGQPYLLGSPMLTDDKLRSLIGDFGKSTQVKSLQLPGATAGWPTTKTAPTGNLYGDVFAGNWSEVLFGRWGGIEIEDDAGKGTGFSKDETYIKVRMYADIGHRQDKAVVLAPDVQMKG